MRSILVSLLVICAAVISFQAEAAERKFSVSNFDTLRINGSIDINIISGKGGSGKATAEDHSALDRVSLRRNGKELIVTVKQKTDNQDRYSVDDPIKLNLTTFAVKKIIHLGSGRVTVDQLTGRNISAQVGGFGMLSIGGLDGDVVEVSMNGGGVIEMAGEVREAQLSLLGSSSFDGTALTAKSLKLTQQGPASTRIAVERNVEIANIGSGMIEIIGRPNCLVRSSGSAQISCNPKR